MKLKAYKAVIFDMDGLVLDTETTYLHAWQQALSALAYNPAAVELAAISGAAFDSLEGYLLEQFGADFDCQEFKQLSRHYWQLHVQNHGIPVKKGFYTLLEMLRNHQLPFGLATNSKRRDALYCLDLAGLSQVFSVISCRDDVQHGKPRPDVFLATAAKLAVSIEDCLILEDSLPGLSAAVAAGADCIYIPSQATTTGPGALAVVADLEQAADMLKMALQA